MARRPTTKRPSVLVVDDFPDGRELVSEYLVFKGFAVTEASTGAEAVEIALRDKPDVILMDLQMPGLDGWEATRRLKADPTTKHIVVVAVTAHALQPETDRARDAGCDAVIAKPFDLAELANALLRVTKEGSKPFSRRGRRPKRLSEI
jgi:two-component system cell cycle response regulator DivK